MTRRTVLLIGAGHAHLHVIANARRLTDAGHEVVVVSPGDFLYSGLATGVLGGHYPPSLDRIDIGALCKSGGARFHRASVLSVSSADREVDLDDGRILPFDALSLDLGSRAPDIPGEQDDPASCFSVKPVSHLLHLRCKLEERRRGPPIRVVVAGGGATAVEIALNIAALGKRLGHDLSVQILAGNGPLLRQLPPRAAVRVRAVLDGVGVSVETSRVVRIADRTAVTEAGVTIPFDLFVNATGLVPNRLAGGIDLPLDERGALRLDHHLRSSADPTVHGGGDAVAIEGHDLPRIGVYAIRQAPVLLHNLAAAVEGREPAVFRPQTHYLWILNLGDGTGLAVRGERWWHGRLAFLAKDLIDRRFLYRYRRAAGASAADPDP